MSLPELSASPQLKSACVLFPCPANECRHPTKFQAEKLKEFRSIDVDGDGKVNKRELLALFDAKSDFWAGREADAVIAETDADADGAVSYEELVAATARQLSPLFPERKFHPLI